MRPAGSRRRKGDSFQSPIGAEGSRRSPSGAGQVCSFLECVTPGAAGCTTDEECTFGGALPTWICADFEGISACVPSCAEDADCQGPGTETYTCTGGGGTYCEAPACTADTDCLEGYTCNTPRR